jgi:predicted porin
MEFIGAGVLDFRILHRFGPVNQGVSQFFGLDQASMRIGFDYGISKNFTIGIGRTTTQKELDGFLKYRPLQQATGPGGSPVSIVLVAGMSIQTYKNIDPSKEVSFNLRSGYYYQVIAGRKFSNHFTLQLSPTLVHRNEVAIGDENDVYAVGVGGRYKFSRRMALVVDYFYVANGLPHSAGTNPLSVGVDIETGGHVFQLHFSNTSGMNERAFITETKNKWGKGDIQFGFNLSRVFNIKKKKLQAS